MPSITNQILSGAKWTSISTACITVIQIVQFALLGRVMSLAEFGLVGMITTVVVFAQIALDMGFGAALIQKDHVTDKQMSSLYWLNIITGLALFAFAVLQQSAHCRFLSAGGACLFNPRAGRHVFNRADRSAISIYLAKSAGI